MGRVSQYRTKRQRELISYLSSMPHKHVTANAIYDFFHAQNRTMAYATIYRQLDRLVAEGVVNKYVLGHTEGAIYEYLNAKEECRDALCIHSKCKECGQLLHLDSSLIAPVQDRLLENHGFQLDLNKTVFYGLCEECCKG